MASLSKRQKLYKVFTGSNGIYYKLVFFAGDSANDLYYDLLTDGTGGIEAEKDVELPDYVIMNVMEAETGYPDSVPWGMPKLETLKLTVWMPGFGDTYISDTTYDNWTDVRDWIKEGRNSSGDPNVWALLSSSDSGSTYTVIESLTIQDVTPEKDFDFSEETYEITGIDLVLTALKKASYLTISGTISPSSYVYNAIIQRWTYLTEVYNVGYYSLYTTNGNKLYYNNLASTDNVIIQTIAQGIVREYMRDSSQSFASYRTALEHITFYKQDTTDGNANKSTVLTDNQLYEIELVRDTTPDNVDGLYFYGEGENLKKLKNAFNIYKEYSENFYSKITVNRSGSAFQLLFQKLFNYRDSGGSVVSGISVAIADIIDKPKMTEGYNIVKGGITQIQNVGHDDQDEYDYDLDGSLSEKQAEAKPLLHNQIVYFNSGYNEKKTLITKHPVTRGIYYVESTELLKVHDYASVDIGTGTDITSGTQSGTLTTLESFMGFRFTRQAESGIGYVLAKTGATAFGSQYQFKIDFKVDPDTIGINDIGKSLDMDIGTFVDTDYLTPPHGTDGVITNIKVDYINSVSECEAFFYDPGI